MNSSEKWDNRMLSRLPTLRVCLSCWRKLPIITRNFLKTSLTQKPCISPVCSSICGLTWSRKISFSSVLVSQQREADSTFDVTKNPYYSKYKEKLKHLADSDPEEFESKIKEIDQRNQEIREIRREELSKPAELPESQTGLGAWPPKSLNDIMKVELIQDKTPEEIERIWAEYHAYKDCVFAIVKKLDYDDLVEKSKHFPTFIYPLPRKEGFEFYLAQFFKNTVYFTSLGMYQLLKENAPPCLVLAHFTEIKEDKGIVLMAGQYDNSVLKKSEALNLVKQMTLFYGKVSSERFNFVRMFNKAPDQFEYSDLIAEYENIKEAVES